MNTDPRSAFRRSLLVTLLLLLGASSHAHAQGGCDNDCVGPVDVPEVSSSDLSPAMPAAALLGGCILVVNERRRKAPQPCPHPKG